MPSSCPHCQDHSLHDELRTGLWMIVDAMRQRNYMYANDIYLKLAIGNSPWPIGVTQVCAQCLVYAGVLDVCVPSARLPRRSERRGVRGA